MSLDLKALFDHIRKSGVPFGGSLNAMQVQGVELIVLEGLERRISRNKLAYMLATTAWETAHTMQPIAERGAKPYFNKYNAGTRIGKILGNTQNGDGYLFRGRGYVQLTGRANYTKAGKKLGIDLVKNPELALDPVYAAPILFAGMEEGWFTGRDVGDYIDDIDESDDEDLREFIASRRVINGTDKADQIGRYAVAFEGALITAGYPNIVPPLERELDLSVEHIDERNGMPPAGTQSTRGGMPFTTIMLAALIALAALAWFIFFKR